MPIRRYLLAFSCLGLLYPAAANASEIISIKQNHGAETITLAPGTISPNKVFILDKPERLVIDIPAFDSGDAELPQNYKDGLIQKLRTGHFNADTSRMVFELREKITVQDKQEKNGKLIIDIAPTDENDKDKQTQPDRGPSLAAFFERFEKPQIEQAKPGKDLVKPSDEKDNQTSPFRKSSEKERKPKQEPKEKPQIKAEKKSTKSGKPVIVIDAGHGGIDPGTSGPNGTVEKMIVLEYAQALRTKLQKSGHYQVVLTRDRDKFIMLRKRVEIARKAGGDIFISLHADSAPGAAKGLSIYTVSEQASDEEAESLAARENKADVLAGINLQGERDDVAGILISLAERDTKNRSATLADLLVMSLDDHVHLLPDSHRFAGFAVLKAPDIPSVLIEIGFLSNPQEEKLIKSKAYRDKVVSGIAKGVENYFKKERQLRE